MIRMIYYFAYGSNMHVRRLQMRTPSAMPITTALLPGHAFHCDKYGADGSAKCNVSSSDGADVPGVVFRLKLDELSGLDRVEGPGYRHLWTEVIGLNGRHYRALLYVATAAARKPDLRAFDWYKALVIEGARQHGLPARHLERLCRIKSRPDSNLYRRQRNQRLLSDQAWSAQRGRAFIFGKSRAARNVRIVTRITAKLNQRR